MTHANEPSAVVTTERVLSANPRQIFAAFEQPNQLARWWGPKDFTNTFEQFEFRPGGRWVFVMHGPNGADYSNQCVFQEIQRDTRVVLEHVVKPWYRLTVTLSPRGDHTHLAWVQEFESPEVAEKMRPISGTANEQVLDRLEALLRFDLIHPNVSAVMSELEQARHALRDAVDAVPDSDRATRPGEGRWCVNEILEHLAMVERRFTALLALRIQEAKVKGLGAEQSARTPIPPELKKMLEDRANRRNAPDAVRPTGTLDSRGAWQAVEDARAELRELLASNGGLALSTVMHQHPVFGTLNVYQFAELIANHERRHANQIAGVNAGI